MSFNPGSYKLVTAKTPEEAIQRSPFFIGQQAEVREVNVSANSDGTWTVTPKFIITQEKPKSDV